MKNNFFDLRLWFGNVDANNIVSLFIGSIQIFYITEKPLHYKALSASNFDRTFVAGF